MSRWGKFISVEGIDGSGKTLLVEGLKEKLVEAGVKEDKVVITREPGGTDFAEKIRQVLLINIPREPLSELFALLAARYENTKKIIIPSLQKGKIVISDRYYDSSFAYQVFGKGLEYYTVAHLNKIATLKLKPKLTILIDISPNVALERLKKDGKSTNYYEDLNLEFFERVRYGYLALARRAKKRIKVINGEQPLDKVVEDAWEHVKRVVFPHD